MQQENDRVRFFLSLVFENRIPELAVVPGSNIRDRKPFDVPGERVLLSGWIRLEEFNAVRIAQITSCSRQDRLAGGMKRAIDHPHRMTGNLDGISGLIEQALQQLKCVCVCHE